MRRRVRRRHGSCRAGQIGEIELGRAIADVDGGARGQGAEGCHALVQHADLAGEAQNHQRQDDDDDPEQDLGDDQGLHRSGRSLQARGRQPEQTADGGVEQQPATDGGDDGEPVERGERTAPAACSPR